MVADAQTEGANFLRGETLPVYYDQSRSILKIPKRRRVSLPESPAAVFAEGLSNWNINFPKLTYWFHDRESDELRRQKTRKRYLDRQLDAVRRAITTATGLRDPHYSVDVPRGLTFRKGKANLHISQLSTGEQVFVALAADLARRLACTTPEDLSPLEGRAIVLIDEVELHLHPKWQRSFVPWLLTTFPNCQFIVTTHSPQVLTEVASDSVRILTATSRGTEVHSAGPVFGRDSNHLLRSIFDLDERRTETQSRMRDADNAITNGDLVKAAAAIERLKSEIEGPSPEVLG
jgi:predicted ATP-binding protein involved in virulence